MIPRDSMRRWPHQDERPNLSPNPRAHSRGAINVSSGTDSAKVMLGSGGWGKSFDRFDRHVRRRQRAITGVRVASSSDRRRTLDGTRRDSSGSGCASTAPRMGRKRMPIAIERRCRSVVNSRSGASRAISTRASSRRRVADVPYVVRRRLETSATVGGMSITITRLGVSAASSAHSATVDSGNSEMIPTSCELPSHTSTIRQRKESLTAPEGA